MHILELKSDKKKTFQILVILKLELISNPNLRQSIELGIVILANDMQFLKTSFPTSATEAGNEISLRELHSMNAARLIDAKD